MNCRQARVYIDDLLLAGPDAAMQQALAGHISACGNCREEYESAKRTLELLQPSILVETTSNLKEKIMNNIDANLQMPLVKQGWKLWKPALAFASMAAVLVLVLAVLKPSNAAYALAQTVEANESLRTIHIKVPAPQFDSAGELWVSLDSNGEVENVRLSFPATLDGPKEVVWENGKAHVWFKSKNSVLTVSERRIADELKRSYEQFDPKRIVERLYEKEQSGTGQVEVQVSSLAGEPITITEYKGEDAARKDVYTVDPETKLLCKRDAYEMQNGKYELIQTTEYLGYNEPIDPSIFTLEAPADATLVDQTTQEVGLHQGNSTDKEIAVKVVRTFFEALIAEDYAKAGQILEGMPPQKLKENLGKMKFKRIISIGEPTPYARNNSLRVPCKIEIEKGGTTSVFEPYGPFVRQAYNQPGRWTICGGI